MTGRQWGEGADLRRGFDNGMPEWGALWGFVYRDDGGPDRAEAARDVEADTRRALELGRPIYARVVA